MYRTQPLEFFPHAFVIHSIHEIYVQICFIVFLNNLSRPKKFIEERNEVHPISRNLMYLLSQNLHKM